MAFRLLTRRLKAKPANSAAGITSISPCTARYRTSCVAPFTSNGVNNTKKMRKEHEKRTFSMYPLREVVTVFNPTVNHNDSRPGRTRP